VTERLIIVDHVLFVVEDFPASRRLYTAALAPLGIVELNEEPNCISYGREDLDDFAICEGSPVTTAAHVAFDAADREQVDAFFEAALAAGARAPRAPGGGVPDYDSD
jgi:catechol 2,3-dioxygenase-like lactoylglutathione lyase family enzyme